jgi:hypothetical protein
MDGCGLSVRHVVDKLADFQWFSSCSSSLLFLPQCVQLALKTIHCTNLQIKKERPLPSPKHIIVRFKRCMMIDTIGEKPLSTKFVSDFSNSWIIFEATRINFLPRIAATAVPK